MDRERAIKVSKALLHRTVANGCTVEEAKQASRTVTGYMRDYEIKNWELVDQLNPIPVQSNAYYSSEKEYQDWNKQFDFAALRTPPKQPFATRYRWLIVVVIIMVGIGIIAEVENYKA